MERKFLHVLSIIALLSTVAAQAGDTVRYRSQSINNARKNAGLVGHTHLYDKESWYGTFDITVGGGRSFRSGHLADCLFGCAVGNCDQILIQGSQVADRSSRALLADYFYLPRDFSSSVSIDPTITNAYAQFDYYMGFKLGCQDMYFRAYAPVVWTKWDLDFCESTCDEGTEDHPCGYFTPGVMARNLLLDNFTQYARGGSPANITTQIMQDGAEQDVITIFNGLCAGRMTNCDNTKTALADLRLELGWNFLNADDYLFGLYIAAAAPTGNKINARNVFSPVVGNGHHWELGGGVNAKWIFWRCDDEERHFGLYLDATVTHLFKSSEQHTLDVSGKPLSRYMLLERLGTPIIGALADGLAGANPTAQFKYEYAPLANLSTFDVKVSIGAQADVALWLNYSGRHFSWDIGYDFFGQSCSKLSRNNSCSSSCGCSTSSCGCSSSSSCNKCSTSVVCGANLCDDSQENTWAFKGDAQMYGFDTNGETVTPADCPPFAIPLSATQNEATIFSGTNGLLTEAEGSLRNGGVDNAELAFGERIAPGADAVVVRHVLFNSINLANQAQINSSFEPIFVGCCDLDFCTTGRPISNKIWTHLNYTWERCDWRPYLGIGGEVEFGSTEGDDCGSSCGGCSDSCNPCNVSCSDCFDCGVSQWALWLKGGVSFN